VSVRNYMINNLPVKIVDRYIIKEILLPFLAGIAIIGVIMLSSFLFQMTDLIIIKNVSWVTVLKLLSYQLPEIIVQTFPIAILLATMVGLGRLSSDNEFTALRMGGISIYRFIIPLLILGILISGMTYFLNERVVPWSNHKAQNIIRKSILKESMPGIEDDVFFKGPNNRLFYVKEYLEKEATLKKIVIFDYGKTENYPKVITAETGIINNNSWQLKNGIIHKYDEKGHLTLETQFKVMDIEITKGVENFFGEQKTPSEMSRAELKKEIDLFKNSGLQVDSLLVDYHLKLAKPLIAFLFILLGTPLSLSTKDSRAINIVLTIAIVFLYYLILSLARSFGRNGFLPSLLAAWLPNIIFGLLGVILLVWRDACKSFFNGLISRVLSSFLVILTLICIM